MQLLLIRHALPLASTDGADPTLSPLGQKMAARLPAALRRHHITRVVTSPQARARQTAQPLAASSVSLWMSTSDFPNTTMAYPIPCRSSRCACRILSGWHASFVVNFPMVSTSMPFVTA